MNTTRKVSIIVPVYNTELYIRDCLNSIQQQTWTDLEIIVVNDGSTDNSLSVIQDIATNDSRIIIIDNPHKGTSAARNAGLKIATGTHLTFVDSDDMIIPSYIEQMLSAIGDCDICFCGHKVWNQKSNTYVSVKGINAGYEGTDIYDHIPDYHYLIAGIGWRLYRLDTIKNNNILFDEDLFYTEDTLFFYNLLLHTHSIRCIKNTGYIIRRQNPQSITAQYILDIKQESNIIKQFKDLAYQSKNKTFRKEMQYRQIQELNWAVRKIYYHKIGYQKANRIFLSLTKHFITRNNLILLNMNMTVPSEKITVISQFIRSFLPSYLYNRFRHIISGEKYYRGI